MKLLVFFSVISVCSCAKILGYIPMASISHQLPFRPIWRELALRGHEVTLLTTDPVNDPKIKNLKEIDLHFSYEILKKYNFPDFAADESKSFVELGILLTKMFNETLELHFGHPEVKKLLNDPQIKFDLVIGEAQLPIVSGFGWKFDCPFIGVASLDASLLYHDAIGNPSHPIVNPDTNLPIEDHENMSFTERFISFVFVNLFRLRSQLRYYPVEDLRFRRHFGENAPSLQQVQKNMSLLMVSTNPIFHTIRPINPNTIIIGNGLHLNKPQQLPNDLQEYLDKSKNGVIYFSLGSNVKGHLLNDTTKREILNAFSELPYDVLMKMDSELVDVPKNVKVQKWMPQQDILRHPKIKLFISQGGLQSLQESITNGIPLVGIPFFGDQISNVYRMVKKGYGVRVDKKEITKENLKAAILEVIENPKYREKAKEMGELLHDEPMTSLEKAVWWIEYVIRHKGAKHLRSPAVDMPFYIYYMLDVIGFMLAVLLLTLFITYKALKFVIRKIFCKKVKAKKE